MKRALLLFMLLVALGTDAQAGQISGHVTDAETGLPLPGAIVSVPDTTLGAVTDTEGRYTLTLPPGTWALEFSFISDPAAAFSTD